MHRLKGAAYFVLLAGLVCGWVAVARGHSFYDRECCSDNDCAPMHESETPKPLPGGDWLLTTGEVVERAKVKWSPDGRYHLCRLPGLPVIFCLYVPPSSS